MKNTGVTLLEILIVVVVLGILAGIAVAKFSSASEMAREATRQSDRMTLSNQLELYRIQHGDTYPWEFDEVGEDLDQMIAQLTKRTNRYGELMPDGGDSRKFRCGPYLDKFPTYLFARKDTPVEDVTFDDVISFEEEVSYSYSSNSQQAAPPPPSMDSAPAPAPPSSGGSSTTSSSGPGGGRGSGGGRGTLR